MIAIDAWAAIERHAPVNRKGMHRRVDNACLYALHLIEIMCFLSLFHRRFVAFGLLMNA